MLRKVPSTSRYDVRDYDGDIDDQKEDNEKNEEDD